MTERLGKYFTLEEMTRSSTAQARGIANIPDAAQRESLRLLVVNVLDPLREHLGRPIAITSGYRGASLNRVIGGSPTSQHSLGQAADFKVYGRTTMQICQVIRDLDLPFDQLIEEFGSWVHVSYGSRHRRQFLLARKQAGKTVYLPG